MDLDHCMMFLVLFLQSYGEILELWLPHFGVDTWTITMQKTSSYNVSNSGASHVWRKMVATREEVEHDIWWQLKLGNSSFCFDNWTKQGVLYFTQREMTWEKKIEVDEFLINGEWNVNKLMECVSP